MRGLIALDIDGTITAKIDHLPKKVAIFLEDLHADGWEIFFITGRTFFWSFHLLKELSFPYSIGCANGAYIMKMPEKKTIYKKYLTKEELFKIEKKHPSCVVYSENNGCFYCPEKFTKTDLTYLKLRSKKLNEDWSALNDFSELPIPNFPSVRIFFQNERQNERQEELSAALESEHKFHASSMLDSFDNTRKIIQVTAQGVSKGDALKQYVKELAYKDFPVIAAGDDMNDLSMLKFADIKVVMETGPKEVLKLADVIAPSAEKLGIIEGIKKAISLTELGIA